MLPLNLSQILRPWVAGSNGGNAPSGPAGGDLGGTYPNPTAIGLHDGNGNAKTYGLIATPFTLLGCTGPEVSSHIAYRIFVQVNVSAGIAQGFPVTEIDVDVSSEFPGINLGNAVLVWGVDMQAWIDNGETGRPYPLYAYVTALNTLKVGIVNAAAAATSAGTLIVYLARIL